MARSIYKIFFAASVLLTAAGCISDKIIHADDTAKSEIRLTMRIDTPGLSRPASRAVAESEVESIVVVVLEDGGDGNGYTFRYYVPGYSLSPTGVGEYEFVARIVPSVNPLRLLLVANAGASVNSLTAGMTESEVKASVTESFSPAGFTDVLPMSATVDLPAGLTADSTVSGVALVRSAARVDVVNSADDFLLTEVIVYRASDRVQIIPDALTGNTVSAPSIPAGTTRSVTTEVYDVTGNSLTAQIYIPESAIPAAADRRLTATAVVVGGQFGGSTSTTYYRMDFDPDDDTQNLFFGQVLRNHIYRFNISEVLAPGWTDPDEASVYPSTGIEADIVAWDQVTMDVVFDDYDYLGVSSRTVNLSYMQGSTATLSVDTSLDTYTAYWSDASGSIDDEAGSAGPGGEFDDPDGLFNVSISADGSTVTVTALTEGDGSSNRTAYLLLAAGRLRILITIVQGPAAYREDTSINVYGTANEIGRLGNYVLGTVIAPDRAAAYVAMLRNAANFGPSGTVPVEGIFISGLASTTTQYSAPLLSLYDVVYLTYGYNPDPSTILAWIGTDSANRVLIVQYDNLTTNARVMAGLGVAYTYPEPSGTIPPYTLSADAPEFITDGPFGTVDAGITYRVYDNAFGKIAFDVAADNGITPVLLTPDQTGIVLGVDQSRGIVYCGDIDLYYSAASGNPGITIPAGGAVTNDAAVLLANLWAWIADRVLRD